MNVPKIMVAVMAVIILFVIASEMCPGTKHENAGDPPQALQRISVDFDTECNAVSTGCWKAKLEGLGGSSLRDYECERGKYHITNCRRVVIVDESSGRLSALPLVQATLGTGYAEGLVDLCVRRDFVGTVVGVSPSSQGISDDDLTNIRRKYHYAERLKGKTNFPSGSVNLDGHWILYFDNYRNLCLKNIDYKFPDE